MVLPIHLFCLCKLGMPALAHMDLFETVKDVMSRCSTVKRISDAAPCRLTSASLAASVITAALNRAVRANLFS